MPKTIWKGSALLAPLPAALVSCGTAEQPNLLTVAWTGIVCTRPAKTSISIRPERFSHGLITSSREFVINLTTSAMVRAVDLAGVKTGRDGDKFALCGLTPEASDRVSAPRIAESPLSLECRVTDHLPLGSHDLFLADVLSVAVDESLLDSSGKLRLEKASLLAYAHGAYFALGKQLGTFGYSVKKKRPPSKGGSKTKRK